MANLDPFQLITAIRRSDTPVLDVAKPAWFRIEFSRDSSHSGLESYTDGCLLGVTENNTPKTTADGAPVNWAFYDQNEPYDKLESITLHASADKSKKLAISSTYNGLLKVPTNSEDGYDLRKMAIPITNEDYGGLMARLTNHGDIELAFEVSYYTDPGHSETSFDFTLNWWLYWGDGISNADMSWDTDNFSWDGTEESIASGSNSLSLIPGGTYSHCCAKTIYGTFPADTARICYRINLYTGAVTGPFEEGA